ncbi:MULTISPECIES: SDR family NAD(P)-dependent oxidoreductase [Phenylobacterium]|uniref:3-oxoacyl-[acyl-carrier protein] reductase n=1 Tax=Phenylobacterium koreense TaxID=266125 RepID=A0ABV2EE73_9CAUL
MRENLEGKAAIVFGGSRGIGAAIAVRLAQEGADVALTYVSSPDRAAATAKLIEAEGRTALPLHADSADADAVQAAARQAAERLGRLDIAVINAGVLALGAIEDASLADLDRSLEINLRGVFLAIQAAQKHMGAGGRIITIGSNTANRAVAGSSIYGMTKSAVGALVRSAALDLAPRGITVNNVQPGPIRTDMTREAIDWLVPRIPLGRVGEPEEVGGLVAYLARPETGYMTGASITVDGGMSL